MGKNERKNNKNLYAYYQAEIVPKKIGSIPVKLYSGKNRKIYSDLISKYSSSDVLSNMYKIVPKMQEWQKRK